MLPPKVTADNPVKVIGYGEYLLFDLSLSYGEDAT